MLLSICMVTRDAEKNVERVLRSTADLGAEIIVADTGSKDGTVEAVRALGAKVSLISWQDDFADAQNQAMAQAQGDWIFWLNPDEEWLPGQRDKLTAMLTRKDAFAYAVLIQEVMDPARPERSTETIAPRVFRRHADLQYVGRLHPSFVIPLHELARRQNQQVLATDLMVRHHAYTSLLTEEKLRWGTRLLELELRDRPGQLHYLIEYGRNLLRLNDSRGHRVLGEASDQVLAAASAALAPTPSVAALLEYLLKVSPEQSAGKLTAEQAGALALRWFPSSPPLLAALAERAFKSGHMPEAIHLLEALVQLGQRKSYDRSAAFDPAIMAESAFINLGNCYVRLGDLDRAEWWFGQALSSPTHQAQAREGYALVQSIRSGEKTK